MQKVKMILVGLMLLSATACRKYVEIPPTQLRVLKYTSDYSALLNSVFNIEQAYGLPIYASDEVGSAELNWSNTLSPLAVGNAYSWNEKFFGATDEDNDWATLYKQIYTYNTVIDGVMSSEGGTQVQKESARASALVHRAFAYYTLVNIYAKQYDAATAGTDPGVPLQLTTYLYSDLTRASVQKVYDQIVTDLNAALPTLADLPDFNINPSKSAVYALLARVNLNTRNFTEAARYADLTLQLKNTLLDLNAYIANPKTMPVKLSNPEEIYFKRSTMFISSMPLQQSALSVYDTKDLRYQIYTADVSQLSFKTFTTGRGYNRQNLVGDGIYVGPNVPEMMLIKAECAARAGNAAAAMASVNALRKKRFKPAEYSDLTAATGNEALHIVVNERQREFIGRGFRWFDQRRLQKDPGYIGTATHIFKGITYTLEPGSNRYVFPIADKYIALNPEITQNPR